MKYGESLIPCILQMVIRNANMCHTLSYTFS